MKTPIKTVLVAGAQGVIGRAAAEHFSKEAGTTVYAVSRRPVVGHENVQPISADLLDPADTRTKLEALKDATHVVFGEALGILTGDALLTEAFAWLARPTGDPSRQLRAIVEVAIAIDSKGMIGGQVADLESGVGAAATLEQLEFIHRNKTGKLLTASVILGGLLGNATDAQLDALRRFGRAIGLAFQIVDDLLDQEQTSEQLGKTAGKDAAQGKLTYPALIGTAAARTRVDELLDEASENAAIIGGPVNYLAPIGRYICERRS